MPPNLIKALTGLGSLAITTAAWGQTHSWWKTAATALGCVLLGFGKKVWAEIEPQWVKKVAAQANTFVTCSLSTYHKRYAKHLYYKHRTFDVKGFSTQGKFALELETVYVDLSVDPTVISAIQQNPISIPKAEKGSGSPDISAWLQADPKLPRNFAIVGPPGSGKTTLLKHLALVLAAKKGPLKKLRPILLFLRDHSVAIGANPEVKLTELIEGTLKEDPPPPEWFARLLKGGRCLIMFDGLDEVADPDLRRKVCVQRRLA